MSNTAERCFSTKQKTFYNKKLGLYKYMAISKQIYKEVFISSVVTYNYINPGMKTIQLCKNFYKIQL